MREIMWMCGSSHAVMSYLLLPRRFASLVRTDFGRNSCLPNNPYDIRLRRWRGFNFQCGHVPTRRGTEHAPVFAAELRRALVADAERRFGRVQPLAQHQPPRLLQAQALLVLQWAHRRHALEMEVERRRAHPHLPRQ